MLWNGNFTCWWTLPWRFRDLAKCHSVPSEEGCSSCKNSVVLPPNFSKGWFFWESQSLQKEAEFLFLSAWRKNTGIGDYFETALFGWLMLPVLILCTHERNKMLISATGLESEERCWGKRLWAVAAGGGWGRSDAGLWVLLLEWTSCASWRVGLKVISLVKNILLILRRRLKSLW